jgi:phage shock protein PspC (stress-responsive transcriptional regulator)
MTDEQPTQQMPPDPPPRPPLARSTSDSVIAGVAGGIGRHLNIDPLAVRITFVILSFAGGLGLLAYLACLVFMPVDDPSAPPLRWGAARTIGAGLLAIAAVAILVPNWIWGPGFVVLIAAGVILYLLIRVVREEGTSHLSRVAARIAIGIVLLALAVGGFTAAAAGSALGGGIAIAGLIIACGVGLVGGAFRGGARWLIAPAIVLALPLAAVAATDLDLEGTWGDRTFRPASAEELADGYEMGLGAMRVDLRDVELPPGRTELPLDLGLGEIQVLVPSDMCVITDASVAVGAVDSGDGEQGGIDIEVADRRIPPPGVDYLHIDANIGVGAMRVGDRFRDFVDQHRWRDDAVRPGTSLAACEGPA